MSKEDHRRLFEMFCKERYYGKGTSKTVTEGKAKTIRQAINGEQGGSVTASFKHGSTELSNLSYLAIQS